MSVEVELSEDLKAKNISTLTGKSFVLDHFTNGMKTKEISIYLFSEQPLKSKLIAKVFNKDKQEIGRSIVEVKLEKGDAKYVTFEFDSKVDTQLVRKTSSI